MTTDRVQRTTRAPVRHVDTALLQRGAKGPAVEHLQRQLNKHGAHLAVDGDFGPKTESAVKHFQGMHGLAADGVCGPHTNKALGSAKKAADTLEKGAAHAKSDLDKIARHHHDAPQRAAGAVKRGLSHVEKAAHHGISATAKKEMRNLLHVAERGASGKRPEGRCLEAVQNYLDKVTYGKGKVPRLPFARNYAEFLNRDGNAHKLGLKKLDIHNPYDAPPGAICVVRAGTPGTHHPTAGDIVVRGHGEHLYNDGEMGYGGPGNFPKGNNFVLGVYVPA